MLGSSTSALSSLHYMAGGDQNTRDSHGNQHIYIYIFKFAYPIARPKVTLGPFGRTCFKTTGSSSFLDRHRISSIKPSKMMLPAPSKRLCLQEGCSSGALQLPGVRKGCSGSALELPGARKGCSGSALELPGARKGCSSSALKLPGARKGCSGSALELPGTRKNC